jgi:hypothetical protein
MKLSRSRLIVLERMKTAVVEGANETYQHELGAEGWRPLYLRI